MPAIQGQFTGMDGARANRGLHMAQGLVCPGKFKDDVAGRMPAVLRPRKINGVRLCEEFLAGQIVRSVAVGVAVFKELRRDPTGFKCFHGLDF